METVIRPLKHLNSHNASLQAKSLFPSGFSITLNQVMAEHSLGCAKANNLLLQKDIDLERLADRIVMAIGVIKLFFFYNFVTDLANLYNGAREARGNPEKK